jgi:hypothetical protein
VTERAGTPIQEFSQKYASRNGVPVPFFPGISITNTTPLQPNFGHSLRSVTLFERKIALDIVGLYIDNYRYEIQEQKGVPVCYFNFVLVCLDQL